ncbi:hypothetical protein E2562_003452 [Oryza meyeriana var. granulata]|uniref:Uncharacterized protein n=1 Tax=Oryza meyeriana var. granulata TaxID=110450 RepID=A0A6G1EEN6_9ORYZ|nr:hypothetical protein E2562_003452 [Oryza meyeriana var. granulata]
MRRGSGEALPVRFRVVHGTGCAGKDARGGGGSWAQGCSVFTGELIWRERGQQIVSNYFWLEVEEAAWAVGS